MKKKGALSSLAFLILFLAFMYGVVSSHLSKSYGRWVYKQQYGENIPAQNRIASCIIDSIGLSEKSIGKYLSAASSVAAAEDNNHLSAFFSDFTYEYNHGDPRYEIKIVNDPADYENKLATEVTVFYDLKGNELGRSSRKVPKETTDHYGNPTNTALATDPAVIDTAGIWRAPVRVESCHLRKKEYLGGDLEINYKNTGQNTVESVRFKCVFADKYGARVEERGYEDYSSHKTLKPGAKGFYTNSVTESKVDKLIAAWPIAVALDNGTTWTFKPGETGTPKLTHDAGAPDTAGLWMAPIAIQSTRLGKDAEKISDVIKITYKNTGNKSISSVHFECQLRNAFGEPAGGYSLNESETVFPENLKPGKISKAEISYNEESAKKAFAWPTEIEYTDGTYWKLGQER